MYKPLISEVCVPCLIQHFCTNGFETACDENSQTVPENRLDASAPRDCRCNSGYAHRTEEERGTNLIDVAFITS